MRWRGGESSWCVTCIVLGLVLVGWGVSRIGPTYDREHGRRVVSACIDEHSVEQCLPVRTADITRVAKQRTDYGDTLNVYLDGASEPALVVWPDWIERHSAELVVADWQGEVWAWQESVNHGWKELYGPRVPFWWTFGYLGLILGGGWFVLRFGSELLIEGPSRYRALADQLVGVYAGLSAAGTAILFGFSASRIVELAFVTAVVLAVGVNGVDHWRHWRDAWRRARRVPR
ncbi:hypothetical protein [Streptomyces bobili]|uniref:hypothetical protein n=1 Tax=Streptomyces bobili TaxID=67280 RepID=UPI003818EC7F